MTTSRPRLPEHLDNQLTYAAELMMISKTALVSNAVRHYLQYIEPTLQRALEAEANMRGLTPEQAKEAILRQISDL